MMGIILVMGFGRCSWIKFGCMYSDGACDALCQWGLSEEWWAGVCYDGYEIWVAYTL